MRPRLPDRAILPARVRALFEVVWEFVFRISFWFFLVRLSPWGQEMMALKSPRTRGGSSGNLLQRKNLVALDCDPQTVCSVPLLLDAYDRALEHYNGLRNLRDDDELFAQLGRTLTEHKEAARAKVFQNRVDAHLLATGREVEHKRGERAAYARLSTSLDRVKVF
jgi:hypothetical protein